MLILVLIFTFNENIFLPSKVGNVDDIDNVNKILFICYMHKSKQF